MVNTPKFLRHAATMMAGTALSQVIAFLAAPVLTRLFVPGQFGVFSSIVAASTVLSICATLRYELSIVLPEEEGVAANLAAISVFWAAAFCVLTAVLILAFPAAVQKLLGPAAEMAPAIPPLTFLIACTQVLNFTGNRERRYQAMASGAVGQQAVAAGAGIGFGAAALSVNGLILGRIAGHLFVCLFLVWSMAKQLAAWRGLISPRQWPGAARTYRQFPQFNVPYSLIGTFSREFAILALTAFHQLAAAGFYGLARTIVTAPVSFLSSSLSQVFYKEAAVHIGSPEFSRLTLSMLQYIVVGLTPFFVFGWFWAPEVFRTVFGTQWREAGYYASALMPIALLSLFTSWPERVFEVRQRQYISLGIQFTFDLIAMSAVYYALTHGAAPLTAVHIYVGVQIGYHLAYLFAVFRLAGISIGSYVRFVGFVAVVVLLAAGLQLPAINFIGPQLAQLAAAFIAIVCLVSILLISSRKRLLVLA